ncbi:tryptophan halogenase family protein [Sphingomonas sp.]|uniref:tryptophan halogenase family protein n=1 Tax=Sphingomonas sp. TaxID=28214 RepID=UPI000DB8DE79|nr:tryptophan halogenase family protein [Sphingomonas sp.]PZU10970.1 MAG: tryptophan halogenase [Sphingomonas sp.]
MTKGAESAPSQPASGNRAIRSIVIVGGGTAGWMAATMLVRRLEKQPVRITVVESSEISTVGVGEATVPGIRDFFREIGVTEQEVLVASRGTVKLGIEFVDWKQPGERFFHPFGLYGMRSRGVAFHQYWLKMRQAGLAIDLEDYCLATAMARANRFMLPTDRPVHDLLFFDWAVHFDAGLFAKFLAARATAQGVGHVDARIVNVRRNGESGMIDGVDTACGKSIDGDLFIDCSGFRSLLLGAALGSPYEDWTNLLPCDRAVAMPCELAGPLTPFTRSTALAAGWQWRIPLQHRVGNGYVYSSRHLSDDEAVHVLRSRLEGEALAEPNMIRFRTGHRRDFWRGNCVALGLAAGFMEPLESTSITLIQTGIEKLLALFPDRDFDPALAAEYNRTTALEYERIRDFLLLHYWANRRRGEPMWDRCRDTALPETLARKIRLFKAHGHLVRYDWESFHDPSWLSMYAGFDIVAAGHDRAADYFSLPDLESALARMRDAIGQSLALAEPHDAFLKAYCAA